MDEVREYVCLSELLAGVREVVEDAFPAKVWVRAELSSVQVRTNGHCYLELCEQADGGIVAKARAVIWRSCYQALASYFREATGGDLIPGLQVLLRVQTSYSELYGLTLTVDEIEPEFTLGAAELQRRKTLEKLEKEGLLDRQKELAMPDLPYRLAVISAPDAAGYGDFRRHLDENPYGFKFSVTLFEATMQGENAPESIVDALERIEAGEQLPSGAGGYDAVLLMRGGGSSLDLACFDDYGLAFTIANCPVPVLTAIGHDRDFHVADRVAYDYVKTPTALADLFIDAFAAEDERISGFSTRLRLAFRGKIADLESRLDLLAQRIRGADPRTVLSRGYTLVTDPRGVVLKKAASLKKGDRLRILFEDGRLDCTVDGKV